MKQGLADAQAAAAPRPPPPAASYGSGAARQAGAAGELVLLVAHLLMIATAVATVQPLNRYLSWQVGRGRSEAGRHWKNGGAGRVRMPAKFGLNWRLLAPPPSYPALSLCLPQAYFLFCRISLVASGYKVRAGGCTDMAGGAQVQQGFAERGSRPCLPTVSLVRPPTQPPPFAQPPPPPQAYLRLGPPALRPFPAAAAPWLQRLATSNEFFAVMLTTLMMQSPQLWMGVVPLAVGAAFPALQALGARAGGHPTWRRYGAPAQAVLEQNKASWEGWRWSGTGLFLCSAPVLSWHQLLTACGSNTACKTACTAASPAPPPASLPALPPAAPRAGLCGLE